MATASQTDNDEIYILQRNALASTRLNFQQYLWQRALDYNIHPLVPISQTSRIADIGCGTGLWLLEVSDLLPNATLVGFDNNISQAPPQAWLPKNVELRQWDMMTEIPEGFEGTFDFIHMRLLILAAEDNVQPLVQNVMKLLKPGGWMQWDELDWQRPSVKDAAGQGGHENSALAKIGQLMKERASHDWVVNMDEMLMKSGFENVQRHSILNDKKMWKFATDLTIVLWEEILAGLKGSQQFGSYEKVVRGMSAEAGKGMALDLPMHVTLAKKAELSEL